MFHLFTISTFHGRFSCSLIESSGSRNGCGSIGFPVQNVHRINIDTWFYIFENGYKALRNKIYLSGFSGHLETQLNFRENGAAVVFSPNREFSSRRLRRWNFKVHPHFRGRMWVERRDLDREHQRAPPITKRAITQRTTRCLQLYSKKYAKEPTSDTGRAPKR